MNPIPVFGPQKAPLDINNAKIVKEHGQDIFGNNYISYMENGMKITEIIKNPEKSKMQKKNNKIVQKPKPWETEWIEIERDGVVTRE